VLAAVYAVLARKNEDPKRKKFAAAAAVKAHAYFLDSIQSARQIGANGTLGRAHLNWGYLHQQQGNADRAAGCFAAAIQYFGLCNSETYLVQAQKALALLDQRTEDRQESGSRNATGDELFDPELPVEGLRIVKVGMIA
jgi:tetratricopeptide (TPR) repeat protein